MTHLAGSLHPCAVAGDIEFDDALVEELAEALAQCSKVLLTEAQKAALGKRFGRLAKHSGLEVLRPWTNSVTGRSGVISDARLAQLMRETLPVAVSGGPIQYEINRNARGWVVELINNAGVTKSRTNQP